MFIRNFKKKKKNKIILFKKAIILLLINIQKIKDKKRSKILIKKYYKIPKYSKKHFFNESRIIL